MRICFVLTTPFALNAFVKPVILELAAQKWDVTVLVNTQAGVVDPDISRNARVVDLPIARNIAPFGDLATLWILARLFRTQRFDVVHSITPKAGLLAMLAARLAGIGVRIHTFTGQVWATRTGPMRFLLRTMDKLLSASASALLTDNHLQKQFLVDEGIVKPDRLHVLLHGSIVGVDANRFARRNDVRLRVRTQFGLPADAVLLLYLGRVHPDKGIRELTQSFLDLAARFPQLHLALVGPDEGALPAALASLQALMPRVHVVPLTTEPEAYLCAADIFCLPSYREGFPTSLLEAAAAELPIVATSIYGIRDAVLDGVTGLLVPPRDAAALTNALAALIPDAGQRATLAEAGRARVLAQFSQQVLVAEWLRFYGRQLGMSGAQPGG
ncbi:MAG: glycosyltransferase [Polaromonas sp.]|nr:glycosyltransferase [Polaromonas sp.]